MANDKNKIVQNYLMESLNYTNPDQSQIWAVRHRILKKPFTIKKIKLKKEGQEERASYSSKGEGKEWPRYEQWVLDNINRQAGLLKRLDCQNGPKCHKMIKTTNNHYLVYDQFPQNTLQQVIISKSLLLHETIQLMISIAKSLLLLHQRNILLLHFAPQNIHINKGKPIFFSSWALATSLHSLPNINIPELISHKYEGLAPQLLKDGKLSFGSDIYCLGVLFGGVLLGQQSVISVKLMEMIGVMLSDEINDRPRLIDIIMQLEGFHKQSSGKQKGEEIFVQLSILQQKEQEEISPTFNHSRSKSPAELKIRYSTTYQQPALQNNIATESNRITTNLFKLPALNITKKHLEPSTKQVGGCTSPNNNKSSSPYSPLSPHSTYSPYSPTNTTSPYSLSILKIKSHTNISFTNINAIDTNFFNTSTLQSYNSIPLTKIEKAENSTVKKSIYSKQDKDKKERAVDRLIKQLNKRRSLSVFLFELSQFVMLMEGDFQLSYLLIKYALISLSALHEHIQQHQHLPLVEKYHQIIKLQKQKLLKCKKPLQIYLRQTASQDKNIAWQISREKQTSQRLLKEKIMDFSKKMILHCENQIKNKSQPLSLLNDLFNTYMILKCIEEGTFERFWEKMYDKEFMQLSNQKYLGQQKSLGVRYLKSRIAEVIKKK